MEKILEVRELTKIYGDGCSHCLTSTGAEYNRNICPHCGSIVATDNLNFDLYPGEILGIMGESGSGKSTLVKMLYFDEKPTSGKGIFWDQGEAYNLFQLNAAQGRWLRHHKLGMVYQNPHLGLNFKVSAGGNIAERLLMNDCFEYAKIRSQARELLDRTEFPIPRMDQLPGQFSGGMQQRVQIACALATEPPLLLLDEVTTGLDLSVQARILDLILQLQQQLNVSMIVVSHDLGVIKLLADRTLIMKQGRIVESGLTDQVLEDPQHQYTQQLVSSALY